MNQVKDLMLMTRHALLVAAVLAALPVSSACGGGDKTPTTPAPPVVATLTAPALESPASNQQLDNLRPTVTVRNVTSSVQGSRTYEFQISDSASFSVTASSHIPGFAATISQTGVAEGTNGTTSFTPAQDLQPTTVFYWRARAVRKP